LGGLSKENNNNPCKGDKPSCKANLPECLCQRASGRSGKCTNFFKNNQVWTEADGGLLEKKGKQGKKTL
jgi:hypothetical protein